MGAVAALSTPGVVASCLIFVVLFSSSSSQSGPNAPKPGYMLTLPKVLWSNQTVSAHLNLFNLADEGTITIKFMRSDSNSTVWEQQEKMKGEASKPLELFVPPVTESQMMQLKIEGRFGAATEASTPAYTIDNTQNVYVEARPWITFIQSDKELYLPGQLIRFRILSVTPDLRPRLEPIADVWLEDTTATRVAQWKSVPVIAYVGIAQMEFQLSEEPPQGTWFIKAKIDGQTEMKTIQVAEYVLPKFSLSIVKPDVVLANAASIPIEFCARYTHGQPVKGILNAEISPRTYRYDSNERKLQVKITDQQISGCHKFVVTEAEMGMDNGRLRPYGMQITASFKEEGTDVREDASTSLSFLFHEVELNFYKDTPQFFKPGLDFDGRVRVLSASTGQAVSGEKIEICVSGKQPSGGFQWIPFGCKNLTSGEDGYVKFTVPPVSSNFTELTISAKAVDRPNEEYPKEQQKWGDRMSQAESSHYVKAWYSPSESYIKSDSDVVGSLPCNTKASIHIHLATTSDPPDHLYYEVKSRGSKMTQSRFALPVSSESVPETVHAAHRIELNSTYLFEPKKNMTKFSGVLPLEITPEMSPVAIVLVYYVRPDSEVVADYLKLSVEKCLSHQVTLEWSKSEDYPGSSVKLSVKAEPESACGIRVVDRSVDLLKSSQQLNLNTVFSQLSRFTESYTGPVIKDDWEYCQKRMSERTTTTETPTTEATTTTTAGSDSKSSSTESPEEASKRLTTPHILPFFNYFSSHADALDAFENAGVLAMTDLTIETRPCQEGHLRPMPIWRTAFAASPVIQPTAVDGIAFEEGTNDAGEGIVAAQNKFASSEPDGQIEAAAYGGFNGVQLPKPALKLRDYFPETWLWSVDLVGTEGLVVRDETLPHTVTEWVGNAICSNKKHGFGISNVAKIKAFQPFFIQFTMPYSVKRNEKMPLKVSIFNHMDHDMPVTVTLEDSENLNVTDSGSNSFSFCLKKADSEVVPFNLTFEALGEINVTVEAAVNPSYNQICGPETILAFQDKVVKKMIVEPEGFPVEETRSKFICAQGLEGDEEGNATTWEFELPDNLVKDSERMFVRASGDILGPSLSNLESLVQLPVGCGEQNMVLFAPNIHVMKYLSKTSQLDPTIKERLLRNMRTGYQRELNYKHNDGSYSAFGSSDPEGSMWLTAFVVRSFGQSADFITVDEKQLRDSIAWILSRRLENGCFPKVGTVHHKEMKGGISTDSGSPAPLTAYVLMSLLESGIPVEEQVVEEALNCVSKDTKPSLYTQALAAFAFASSGGNYTIKAEELLSKLLAGGEKKNGLLWIPVDDTLRSAVNVEATAYALLTMAKLNKIDADLGTDKDRATALSMVRWIAQQRNSKGGFVSTQDTVVALEALAEYAAAMGLQGVAMDVFVMEDISENSKLDISKSFSVSEENKLIQQEMKLSSVPKKLTLQGYGTGCALVQASLRYSITDAPPEAAFILELNPMSFYWGPSRKLSICARYDGPGGDSNMVVLEIGMLSGYIPDKGELSKDTEELRNAGVKRWEVNPQNNQLNLYFNSLSPETKCITVDLIQSVQMENLVPAVVRVYDYYNPELFATKNYTFETWAPRPDVKVPADPVPVPAATPIPLQETTAANATTTTAAPSASPAALEETTVPTTVRGARVTTTTSKPDAHPSPKKMADANKKSPGATTTTTPVPSTVTPSSSSRNSTTA